MKTLLVPVDFSSQTKAVLAEAIELALPSRAKLVIVHVLQGPDVVADYGTAGTYLLPMLATLGRDATRHLAALKKKVEARGLEAETVQLTGAARSRLIAAEAEKRSANYIVMGSHGHTALYDLVAGSTTTTVLKYAPCPVIIIPAVRKPAARE